jgi:hypothetical protein
VARGAPNGRRAQENDSAGRQVRELFEGAEDDEAAEAVPHEMQALGAQVASKIGEAHGDIRHGADDAPVAEDVRLHPGVECQPPSQHEPVSPVHP